MPPGSVIRVLLVDDNEDILHIGKLFLERSGIFIVDIAISAPDGYNLMQKQPYDIIVSDYDMPDTDGIAFLDHIRREGCCIPFIICSSKEKGEIQTFSQYMYSYIQKNGDPKRQYLELSDMILKTLPNASQKNTDTPVVSYTEPLKNDRISTGIQE